MNTNQIINVFNLDPYISKYKSYCELSDFLEHIQSFNNTLIIVNSSPSTVNLGHWLYIFQTAKNIRLFSSSWHSVLALKTFLSKVKNLLFKIGSQYKIYQPKVVVFMHYYIFFDVADILTVYFLAFMVTILD